MPYLDFTEGKSATPVAIVRGGDRDGDVLYLHSEEKNSAPAVKKEPKALKFMNDLKHIKATERVKAMSALTDAVKEGKEDVEGDENTKKAYRRMKEETEKDTSIELPDDSSFAPIPDIDPKKRQVWYVAGQSGSGKSYFARGIAEHYKKLFPEREVYLISKLEYDETLDKMKIGKPKRISIQSLVDDYPSIEEFKDCLIIFDDWDTLDKPFYGAVHKLIEDLAIQGRHTRTSMLILSHYLTNYSKTRLILGEAQYLVLYPLATSQKALKYVCEHYGGLDKEDMCGLKKRGRWVLIHKNYPSYIISAHEANMLHQK
jgi:hypothetical protein